MSDPHCGATIDQRFRLQSCLGAGASGSVYEGTQLAVDRVVAIKLLHPGLHQRPAFRCRFELEAKAVARLNHPNCITLFDFGFCEDIGHFFMVTEYVAGERLIDRMRRPVSVELAVNLSLQIAEGLRHAHQKGVLHRDLKPENVMLARNERDELRAKVVDFGLARLIGGVDASSRRDGGGDRITGAGQPHGTPCYMSPEQCLGALDISAATDVYSLGVLMYELLTGRLPFEAEATVDLLQMHIHDAPPPLRAAAVPRAVCELVMSMLSKAAEDRPDLDEEVIPTLAQHVQREVSQEFYALDPVGEEEHGELHRLDTAPREDEVAEPAQQEGTFEKTLMGPPLRTLVRTPVRLLTSSPPSTEDGGDVEEATPAPSRHRSDSRAQVMLRTTLETAQLHRARWAARIGSTQWRRATAFAGIILLAATGIGAAASSMTAAAPVATSSSTSTSFEKIRLEPIPRLSVDPARRAVSQALGNADAVASRAGVSTDSADDGIRWYGPMPPSSQPPGEDASVVQADVERAPEKTRRGHDGEKRSSRAPKPRVRRRVPTLRLDYGR